MLLQIHKALREDSFRKSISMISSTWLSFTYLHIPRGQWTLYIIRKDTPKEKETNVLKKNRGGGIQSFPISHLFSFPSSYQVFTIKIVISSHILLVTRRLVFLVSFFLGGQKLPKLKPDTVGGSSMTYHIECCPVD